jgi:hypothetical protein
VAAANIATNGIAPGAPLKFDPNAVQQIQNQWLGDASPEAQQKYQELIRGLMTGQLDLGDLRNQAQSALKDLKDLQKDAGDDDAAALLTTYSAILENFIKQAPVKPERALPGKPTPVEE